MECNGIDSHVQLNIIVEALHEFYALEVVV